MIAIKIKAIGVVQGVGFRYFTKEKADSLGIHGSVTNLSDGSVEIFAEGSSIPIKNFLKWCHSGPPSSTVDTLEYEYLEPEKTKAFVIIR